MFRCPAIIVIYYIQISKTCQGVKITERVTCTEISEDKIGLKHLHILKVQNGPNMPQMSQDVKSNHENCLTELEYIINARPYAY